MENVRRRTERLDGCVRVAAWGRRGEGMSLEGACDGSEMGRARNMEAHCDLFYGRTGVEITRGTGT